MRKLTPEQIDALVAENANLAAENSALKNALEWLYEAVSIPDSGPIPDKYYSAVTNAAAVMCETPATDAFIAEQLSQAHKEGAYFVANRMLAAWDAGFIDDTAKNAADIARMILTSTDFMKDAPDGDFDRSFADDMLAAIARQLRDEVKS